MAIRAVGGAVCGLMMSGLLYLYLVWNDLAGLQIPDSELRENEVVLLMSSGSMVHYKSGLPLRFWDAIGGRLFLTKHVLEIRAHRGQHALYQMTIPLSEIVEASPCRILGVFPGGLRVERIDGSVELFTFDVHGDSPSWADAIVAAKQLLEDDGSFAVDVTHGGKSSVLGRRISCGRQEVLLVRVDYADGKFR